MPCSTVLDLLRYSHVSGTRLVAWVLLSFVGSLAVAVASPLVAPKVVELVCSTGGGMKLIVHGDDGDGAAKTSHTLDCPLCQLGAAPPSPPPSVQPPQVLPLSVAMQPIEAARIRALTAAPPPSRGPPAFS